MMRERKLTYILVAQVEDKLVAVILLAFFSCSLGNCDVELEGGVSSQVSQIAGIPHLHCRIAVKPHGYTNLKITGRKMTGENKQSKFLCIFVIHRCWCFQ